MRATMKAAMRAIERCLGVALTVLLAAVALALPAGAWADDDRHDDGRRWNHHDIDHDGHEWDRHRHDPRRAIPNVEVIVDGLHLGDRERPVEESAGDDAGVTICHQAGGTVWSTGKLPCQQPTPPERSNVWSTSP